MSACCWAPMLVIRYLIHINYSRSSGRWHIARFASSVGSSLARGTACADCGNCRDSQELPRFERYSTEKRGFAIPSGNELRRAASRLELHTSHQNPTPLPTRNIASQSRNTVTRFIINKTGTPLRNTPTWFINQIVTPDMHALPCVIRSSLAVVVRAASHALNCFLARVS